MLQRSVTLTRRLLCARPKESTSCEPDAARCRSLPPKHSARPSPLSYLTPAVPARPPSAGRLTLDRRGGVLPAGVDPLLAAIGPDFLLPDRDGLLEGVDQPAAGLERFVPVRAAHR